MTTNAVKVRRSITLNLEEMVVRIAEHTGTQTDGDYTEIASAEFTTNDLNNETAKRCELHGLAQKLTDCTAGMSDAKGHTTEERFEKVGALFGQLKDGEWTKKAEGAGTKLNQTQIKSKMAELGLNDDQYALAVKMGLIKA